MEQKVAYIRIADSGKISIIDSNSNTVECFEEDSVFGSEDLAQQIVQHSTTTSKLIYNDAGALYAVPAEELTLILSNITARIYSMHSTFSFEEAYNCIAELQFNMVAQLPLDKTIGQITTGDILRERINETIKALQNLANELSTNE